jgi:hypothetical protein
MTNDPRHLIADSHALYFDEQIEDHSLLDVTDKTSSIKSDRKVAVILFSKYSFADPRQKELVRWVGTTLQSAIGRQHEIAKKIFLRILKDTPAIYMS